MAATCEATCEEKWLKTSIEKALSEGKSRQTFDPSQSASVMKVNPHEIALELLSQDWLTSSNTDLSTRLYLAEKVLPVLVLSLEQLLVVVSRRSLQDEEEYRDDFNPVNFVAEFLMRNNPRYPQIAQSTSSRYYNGLKEVSAQLKRQLTEEEERVTELVRLQLREKRESEEEERRKVAEEEERRKKVMKEICLIWHTVNTITIAAQQVKIINY